MSKVLRVNKVLDTFGEALTPIDQYRAVVVNADGVAAYPGSSGILCTGIAVESGDLVRTGKGDGVEVVTFGLAPMKIKTAAGLTAGALVYADTDGQGVATGTVPVGTIVVAPTNNGDIAQVFVMPAIANLVSLQAAPAP